MRREEGPPPAEAAGFSAWWWLGLPVAVAVVLALVANLAPDFYRRYVHGEQGALEMGQAAVTAAATLLGLWLLSRPAARRRPWLLAWIALATVAAFYVTGEELSWGQHLLNWSTPEYWRALNDQGETNLHNVSSWLDQKPRALLEAGVVVGGIILPLLALWRPAVRSGRFGIIVPPLFCLPTAVMAETARLFERLGEWLDTGTIFHRPAEYQELYFYLFVLFYLIALGQRLRAGAAA